MPHKSFHDFCPPELNFLHFQAKKTFEISGKGTRADFADQIRNFALEKI